VVKHLLSNKEFNVFFITLNAFMNWAEITDISDLNFMVPDDQTVQQLLQNFMSNRRIDMEQVSSIELAMAKFNQRKVKLGTKDAEIME
jgi:hypothetical protein